MVSPVRVARVPDLLVGELPFDVLTFHFEAKANQGWRGWFWCEASDDAHGAGLRLVANDSHHHDLLTVKGHRSHHERLRPSEYIHREPTCVLLTVRTDGGLRDLGDAEEVPAEREVVVNLFPEDFLNFDVIAQGQRKGSRSLSPR